MPGRGVRKLATVAVAAVGALVAAGLPGAGAAAVPAPPTPGHTVLAAPGPSAGFVPIAPVRAVDTRNPAFSSTGSFAPGETRLLQVAAPAGVDPAAAASESLNVTLVAHDGPSGYLTVWPAGQAMPTASTLNFGSGDVVANGIVVATDASGQIAVFNGSGGPVDVLVDVMGWLPRGNGLVPLAAPTRVLDTRTVAQGPAIVDGRIRLVPVLQRLGLPTDGTYGAATLNVTVTRAVHAGWARVWPADQPEPPTSSVNFVPGKDVANSAVLGLSATGGLAVDVQGGPVDVLIDVTGLFERGKGFVPVPPVRLIDTRSSSLGGPSPLAAAQPVFAGIERLALSRGANLAMGVPAAFALNLTVTQPAAPGYVTTWPMSDADAQGAQVPATSSLNYRQGQDVANTVLIGAGEGSVDLTGNGQSSVTGAIGLQSYASTHLVIDLTGYFPQEQYGFLADATAARQYSLGTDRVAVVLCYSGSPYSPSQVAEIQAHLDSFRNYYARLSGDGTNPSGRYDPVFGVIGQVSQGAANAEDSACLDAVDQSGAGAGYDSVMAMRTGVAQSAADQGVFAYGFASPGAWCENAACARSTWPANQRGGLVTANTLLASGTPSPGADGPYLFVTPHEIGHTVDWPHSYTGLSGSQYDNPLDVMSEPAQTRVTPRPPQGTPAVNRYAAGWLDPSQVAVHRGGTVRYTIGPQGTAGAQLLVVPGTAAGTFLSIEARASTGLDAPTGGTPATGGALQREGVAVMRVDQRAATNPADQCYLAASQSVGGAGLGRCSGLDRRHQPYGPLGAQTPGTADAVMQAGQSMSTGGVTVTVVSGSAQQWVVEVSGSTVSIPSLTGGGTGGDSVADVVAFGPIAPHPRAADRLTPSAPPRPHPIDPLSF